MVRSVGQLAPDSLPQTRLAVQSLYLSLSYLDLDRGGHPRDILAENLDRYLIAGASLTPGGANGVPVRVGWYALNARVS